MRDIVITVLALAVVMLGGRFLVARRLSSSGPVHVASKDGSVTLRAPRRDVMLGVLALAPAAVLGFLTFQAGRSGGDGLAAAVVATLLAAGAAAYLFASATRSRMIVRDTGIERIGVFRRRLIAWSAFVKIAFNPAQRWFFLTMSDGSHLWLRADIAGIGDFAVMALRRVKPAVLEAADPVVREVLEDLAEAAATEARR